MEDLPRTRAARFAVATEPNAIDAYPNQRRAWYESPEEILEGIARGRETARLLRWVNHEVDRRLTVVERRAITAYYYENLSYRQAAAREGVHPSSIHRAVKRGIRKLQIAAAEDAIEPRFKY